MKRQALRSGLMSLPLLLIVATTPALAETLRIGGTGGALGVMQALGAAFNSRNANIELSVVPGLGSSGGKKALLAGALDLAVSSRPGSAAEKAQGAVAYPYGRSPLLIAVSQHNPVNELSVQDIVDIYSGKKLTWPNGERLRLILRPVTDSDSQVLKTMSPQMDEALQNAHKREGMKIAVTDEESADAIEATPGGVGSSMLSLVVSEKRALKGVAIGGAKPMVKNVVDGSYPWFKTFYIVTAVQPTAPARAFVEFVFSPRGRQMLSALGHWTLPANEAP